MIDSYSKGNRNASIILNALTEGVGQTFVSPLSLVRLTDAAFLLQRNAAFNGTLVARLYYAAGVVGTTAVPDIAAGVLATSDNVTQADINPAWGLVNFHFSTPYTLDPERDYVIVLVLTVYAAGQVEVGIDATALPHVPTHLGNETNNITFPPLWTPNPLNDCVFYLFSYSDVLAGGAVDVTDRAARLLGKVQLTDYVNDGIVYPHDGSIPTAPAKVEVATLDDLTGISLLTGAGWDSVNLALSTDHRGSGTNSVEWDKAGTDLSTGVQIALPAALDLGIYSTHAKVMWFLYLPTPGGAGNVTQVYVALGSSITDCFYWEIPAADLHFGVWWHYHHLMSEVSGVIGVGADLSNITWAAIVIVTDNAACTLADIKVDQIVVKRSWETLLNQCSGQIFATEEASPTEFLEDQVTLTGAAQQLPNDPCQSMTLENPAGNAVVAVGHDNTVTLLNGYRLYPGATMSFDIDNVNKIWVIGTLNEIISYFGVN